MSRTRLSESVILERKSKLLERGISVINEYYKDGRLWWDVECRCGNKWNSTSKDLTTGGQGCGKCASDRPLTHQEAIAKVEALSPGKFLFLEPYRSTKKTWKIQCTECDWVWEPRAGNIMRQFKGRKPKGCPECARRTCGDKTRLTLEEVNLRLSERDIKLLSPYRRLNDVSQLECLKCGEPWECKLSDIFNSHQCGCPDCADYGFKPHRPALLYYVRLIGLDGKRLWKVGVTNGTVAKRLYSDRDLLEATLFEYLYPLGSIAKAKEQAILRENAIYLYKGPKFLRCGGNSEIFTRDVLIGCYLRYEYASLFTAV